MNQLNGLLPVGLLAQLVERCTSIAEKRGRCKGSIPLSSVKAVEFVDDTAFDQNRKFCYCFQVVYDDLVLYVNARSEQEKKEWVEAIQDGRRYTENSRTSHFIASQPLPPIPPTSGEGQPQLEQKAKKEQGKKPPEVVVAIYDFRGAEQGDLSLLKGENLTVIDKQSDHWWIAKNSRGEQGYIPSNYVRRQGLESESWFQPEMSRQLTEDILKKEEKEGCFLVRNSSKEGMYTLSVLHGDHVRHYHIKKDNGQLYISDRHRFPTVSELINYHQHNSGGSPLGIECIIQCQWQQLLHEYLATSDVPMGYADSREQNFVAYQPFKTYCDPSTEGTEINLFQQDPEC
ncbi:Tyrosine-protein kinase Tec [Stylophora pistillata]|uniref:Tyrosine-protein kinase Tec n=1 Tax=Stylophora pistillata TaxID=50429 RepID=A0A2B4RUL9_STYPI|nr:Tyrosine-protein kinase Tec [Stylophora pistillata]